MALPNFTAGRSLYRTSGHYRMAGVHKQADRSVRSAQLPSCISGGLCYTPQAGFFCSCPPGQECKPLPCPRHCYRVCFLWWCWTRCERPEVCPTDWSCQ